MTTAISPLVLSVLRNGVTSNERSSPQSVICLFVPLSSNTIHDTSFFLWLYPIIHPVLYRDNRLERKRITISRWLHVTLCMTGLISDKGSEGMSIRTGYLYHLHSSTDPGMHRCPYLRTRTVNEKGRRWSIFKRESMERIERKGWDR